MVRSDSARVIGATAIVALAIMGLKTLIPAIPLSTTVMAAIFGLVLIFSLFRSDALRRRRRVVAQPEAEMPAITGEAIRHRLEARPLPQVSAGPRTRTVMPVLELTDVVDVVRR